ncbi:bifunctional adenosylcobinamide kinase/adenosylcobinamide-phosphate guanylyltransferase, partial [Sphingomonas bacterium]|uniref:bifunctional adenosylcobinamide kinase/adenosylcobinamide-phosphate guanylyltransferase n=1 Tax=Sphingomonas bacterium TaxID=1895847 RepID=UPI0015762645
GGQLVFIATAQAFDDEMTARIARHRADRGEGWTTREAPLELAGAIAAADRAGTTILVDCLTLWTSNLLLADRDIPAATDALVAVLAAAAAQLILVTNEVGAGIVPDNALARAFRDAAGIVNQRVAAAVARVDLMVAGLPLRLK